MSKEASEKLIVWLLFLFIICAVLAYPVVPYLIPRHTFFVILLDYTIIYFSFSGLLKEVFL